MCIVLFQQIDQVFNNLQTDIEKPPARPDYDFQSDPVCFQTTRILLHLSECHVMTESLLRPSELLD